MNDQSLLAKARWHVGAKVDRYLSGWTHQNRVPVHLERPIITVTFDDFPRSALTQGAPVLEAFGGTGVYYACAGFESGQNHFGDLYTWADVKALREGGHELACHTSGHLSSRETTPARLAGDCAVNRSQFAANGVETLDHFAFPFGEITASAKARLGPEYQTLRSIDGGLITTDVDLWRLPAFPAIEEPKARQALMKAAMSLADIPGWLIVYTHDVREDPTEWGCTRETLADVVATATGAGAEIKTLSEALELILPEEEKVEAEAA